MATRSSSIGGPAREVAGSDREIILERTFDAPRELVFDAFTDPAHIGQWWGPNGFRTTTERMDLRPGGVWQHVMHGPDGTDYPNYIVYEEVERPARLSWQHGTREGEPFIFHATVTFEERDGGTVVTLRQEHPSKEARAHVIEFGAIEGGRNTLDRLAAHLETLMTEGA